MGAEIVIQEQVHTIAMALRRGRPTCVIWVVLVLAPWAAAQGPKAHHDKEFWRQIVRNDYHLPAGESASALILELDDYLGSPDPELRDEFAYEISATWIYRDNLLSPTEIRRLVRTYEDNLTSGLGESDGDSVLLRSFSALSLSTIAALDNKQAVLSDDEFRELLASSIRYMNAEHDLRGYDPQNGWFHATAHTADLFKFLGRNSRLKVADQAKVLDAIRAKLQGGGHVFVFGENERMAGAILSLVMRKDFDEKAFASWLKSLASQKEGLWAQPKLDVAKFAAVQNSKDLLRSLLTQLSLLEQPAPNAVSARNLTLSCLKQLM